MPQTRNLEIGAGAWLYQPQLKFHTIEYDILALSIILRASQWKVHPETMVPLLKDAKQCLRQAISKLVRELGYIGRN